jgi:hypothetical protein
MLLTNFILEVLKSQETNFFRDFLILEDKLTFLSSIFKLIKLSSKVHSSKI